MTNNQVLNQPVCALLMPRNGNGNTTQTQPTVCALLAQRSQTLSVAGLGLSAKTFE
jgi:hypothetical protein